MSLFEPTPGSDDPARLRLESGRTCDRLRSISLTRLDAPLADGRSRARAALDLAQELADAAAHLSGRPARVLPELASPAAGDVLAVCALDLAEELDQSPGDDAMALCRRAVRDMVALRQQL